MPTHRSLTFALALLALALPGCGKLLGIDDLQLADAGLDDAPPDGPGPDAPDLLIHGRSATLYSHGGASQEVGTDLSATVVQALIPDGTGYRAIDAVRGADGHFTIEGVPPGTTYLLKLGRRYYVTDTRTPRLINHYAARLAPTATQATPVQLQVAALQPLQYGGIFSDALHLTSAAVGYDTWLVPGVGGDTTAGAAIDWHDGFGTYASAVPLVDTSAGDDLWILQERSRGLSPNVSRAWPQTTIVAAAAVTGVTIRDGAPATIAATLAPVAADRSLAFSISRGSFDAVFHPSTALSTVQLELIASPGRSDYAVTPVATIALDDWSRRTSLTATGTLDYGDPLPAPWIRYLRQTYARTRRLRLPGTTTGVSLSATYYREVEAGAILSTPDLQPPPNLRLAGQDAFAGGRITFDGTSRLTLAWGPVAAARSYRVLVLRIYADGTRTRSQTAATLTTRATTIDLPAEVLVGGEYWSFLVTAIASPNDHAAGELVDTGHPVVQAAHVTGLFRLSATCGNGALDPGEDCDGATATATCDVDCSPPLCGDGLHNPAAGEACDDGTSSARCDADCTPAACGDGYTNPNSEDCDDGNTVDDGNGCSGGCRLSNACGDGIVAAYGESCDTGPPSPACNGNCTPSSCGDTYLNPAAGEQCDDGGTAPHDGCDAACQLE